MTRYINSNNNHLFFQEFLSSLEKSAPITRYRLIETEGKGYSFEEKPYFRLLRIIKEFFLALFTARSSSINDHTSKLFYLGRALTDLGANSVEHGHELLACSKTSLIMNKLMLYVAKKQSYSWKRELPEFQQLAINAMTKAALIFNTNPLWLSYHNKQDALTAVFLTVPQYVQEVDTPEYATELLRIALHYNLDVKVISQLVQRGADINQAKLPLDDTLVAAIEAKEELFAQKLVEAGANVNYKNKRSDVPLLMACSKGMHTLAKLMLTKNPDLNLRDAKGNTLFHAACIGGLLDIATELREKIDVTKKNDEGFTAFQYLKSWPTTSEFEKVFLRQDLKQAKRLISNLTCEQFFAELEQLKQKYPRSPLGVFQYCYLDVDDAHYSKVDVDLDLPEPSIDSNLSKLLELFNEINFDDPTAEQYWDPNSLLRETGGNTKSHFEAELKEFIRKISDRVAFQGTPDEGSPAIETFYSNIEKAIKNCLATLNNMDPPEKKKELQDAMIISFIKASSKCAGRYHNVSLSQYRRICKGKELSPAETFYFQLADLRYILSESSVEGSDAHNVNAHNFFLHHMGKKYGIPGYKQFASYNDPFGYRLDILSAEKKFLSYYSVEAIFDWLVPLIKNDVDDLRTHYIDWQKANIPDSFRKEHFEKIVTAVRKMQAEQKSVDEINKYLESNEIFPGKDPFVAIEQEKQASYLGTVVFDEETNQLRTRPIIDMLIKLEVFTSLFDKPPPLLEQIAKTTGNYLKRFLDYFI